MIKPILVALVGAAAIAPLASRAAPSADATALQVAVSARDLNLRSEDGVRLLYARLQDAARRVCGEPDPREIERHVRARRCAREALQNAIADANLPRLSTVRRRPGTSASG